MQTEASVHSLFIKEKNPTKEKAEHRKRPRRVHKREEIMTAEVFFPLSHFSLVCWNFHPSKPYFLVPGFTLTPIPLKTSFTDNNPIEYLLQKRGHHSQTKCPPRQFFRLDDFIGSSDPSQSPVRAISSALAKCHLSSSSLIQCNAVVASPGFLQFLPAVSSTKIVPLASSN